MRAKAAERLQAVNDIMKKEVESRDAAFVDLIDFNTPTAVTCNEAVNLANRYSDEKGRRMINGVLRKLQNSTLKLN